MHALPFLRPPMPSAAAVDGPSGKNSRDVQEGGDAEDTKCRHLAPTMVETSTAVSTTSKAKEKEKEEVKEEGKEKSGAKTTGIGTRAGGVTRCRRRKSLLLPSDLLDGGDDGDDDNGEFELPLTYLMKG